LIEREKEVFAMAKKMTITMKADGMIDKVDGQNVPGKKATKKIKGEYVATILYSPKNPDCWYYYLPNGECIEVCI
jgi:hypothetical protein